MAETPELLDKLLRTGAPSGYEAPVAEIWRDAASFATLSSDGLGSSIARIGEELHSQYIITYNPSNKDEGGFHEIRVNVDPSRDFKIKARPGYWMATVN